MDKSFSHLDTSGTARMVDVGAKPPMRRTAVAEGTIICAPETIELLRASALPKGDVLAVARVAGIQAAKQTSNLIPLCHPLAIDAVQVDFSVGERQIDIKSSVRTTGKTGVEMEALTGVTIAALTLYDMMKAVDSTMEITGIRVLSKEKAALD